MRRAGPRTDDNSRDEKKLLLYQKRIAAPEVLIVDELGFVPLSKTGAELLFKVFSQRYERASTLLTSYLPLQDGPRSLAPNASPQPYSTATPATFTS